MAIGGFSDLRRNLNAIFNQKVQMDKEEQKLNKELVQDCINALLNEVCDWSSIIRNLFKQKIFSGSIYEKLRIKNPTEFDIDLVFQLPFDRETVQIISRSESSDHIQYRIKQNAFNYGDMFELVKHFIDEDGYLLRDKFQNGIYDLINKAWNAKSFQHKYHKLLLKHFWEKRRFYNDNTPTPSLGRHRQKAIKKHGPAITLYIVTLDGDTIGVDLVPLIQPFDGNYRQLPSLNKTPRFLSLKPEHRRWFMLPKPFKGETFDDPERFWQVCFPEAEKHLLIEDQGIPVKKLIRLTKFLRDEQNWTELKSYFIKTLYLLERDKNADWNEFNLGIIYVKMLRKLLEAFEKKELRSYFFRKVNLFSFVDDEVLEQYENKLRKIIKRIQSDPDYVWNCHCQSEQEIQVTQPTNGVPLDVLDPFDLNETSLGLDENLDEAEWTCAPRNCIIL